MLQFLTLGFFQGAVYGLLAVGLVLVYRGARVFNFAQAEFGTVAAYVMYALWAGLGLPMGVGVVAGLAAALLLGLLTERLVIRPLFDASRITVLVATVGVALLIIGITIIAGKAEPKEIDPLIPGDFVLLNTFVSWQQVLVVATLLALAAALALFFRRTTLGLAVLATSQDPFATQIVGISVPGMSRLIWTMAAFLGGIAGILQAPIAFVTPGFMTVKFLVPAFAGAVLGGMTSLPGAFLGGILVGVAEQLGIFWLGDLHLGVPGAGEFTVFMLLLLVLLIRPQGILGKEA
jgi:branched-chain amino acid transport system permease protein